MKGTDALRSEVPHHQTNPPNAPESPPYDHGQRSIPARRQPPVDSACRVIDGARDNAYRRINQELVLRNWLLGKLIAEDELAHQARAQYGLKTIANLSRRLTQTYGRGFSQKELYNYRNFYCSHNDLFVANTQNDIILYSLSTKFDGLLSWTHDRILLQEPNDDARAWYEKEAREQTWSVRTLQRNISSQFYHRLLASQRKDLVQQEMLSLTAPTQRPDPTEFIKNPIIGEFLGFQADASLRESDLKQAIITNLERFILEMGKGFAFVARQQHIHTEKEDYFIDLVFYNYILKAFVLIDLKTSKITHQDVGQMDMYLRMYDELRRTEGDNPTVGIILCGDTDEDIARYSILHDRDNLFASRYMLYMPSPEQLRQEIERQKAIFYLQQQDAAGRSEGEMEKEGRGTLSKPPVELKPSCCEDAIFSARKFGRLTGNAYLCRVKIFLSHFATMPLFLGRGLSSLLVSKLLATEASHGRNNTQTTAQPYEKIC